MAKDIDSLLRDVFGSGKTPYTVSTKKAEDYLKQSKQVSQSLDDLSARQQQLNQKLQSQLAEMKQLSGELDLDRIQREVDRDFGITSAPKAAVSAETVRGDSAGAERFPNLLPTLTETLIGQDDFLKSLLIAFKRPYVVGTDPDCPIRNRILVTGSPNSGRHTAISLIAAQLAEAGLLSEDGLRTLDLALYPGQGEEKLFLQDLYQALQPGGIVLLEHYESCHPAFLQQLGELLCTGRLHLSSRYVMQNGHLVDAGTALASKTVGTLSANGAYLVIISEQGKTGIADAFGAKVVNVLGDCCRTGELSHESLCRIAQRQEEKLSRQTQKQLGFQLTFPQDFHAFLAEKYTPGRGLEEMLSYCKAVFQALAQYKLERDAPAQTLTLSLENRILFAVLEGEKRDILALLPERYRGELEAVKRELAQIVGLKEIKDYILSLEDHFKVQQLRREQGMKTGSLSMHMIFTGNPGTGKTTIARLISKYLKAIGVLSGGQLVEVTRADLVGKYVGHTAPLTMQVLKSAIGGVLFIDEAYSLYRGGEDSFGLEAIDTLVKGMEDNREDLIVILAGYTKEMETFLTANSGLRSRFPNQIEFPDYSGEELAQIAEINASSKGYRISDEAKSALLDYFCVIQAMGNRESGNGRLARNVIERAILAQSRRMIVQPGAALDLLEKEDFDLFEGEEPQGIV